LLAPDRRHDRIHRPQKPADAANLLDNGYVQSLNGILHDQLLNQDQTMAAAGQVTLTCQFPVGPAEGGRGELN